MITNVSPHFYELLFDGSNVQKAETRKDERKLKESLFSGVNHLADGSGGVHEEWERKNHVTRFTIGKD